MSNLKIRKAQKAKADEFYTLYETIERELEYYHTALVGKVVYCPCDNPAYSNFYKFFKDNFHKFQLKELRATYYNPDFCPLDVFTDSISQNPTLIIYDGESELRKPLKGDGDFRSEECVEILRGADVVITNPPFSLFRDFIDLLVAEKKDFLFLMNGLAVAYKTVIKLFSENKCWLGHSIHSGDVEFQVPESYPLKGQGYRISDNGERFLRVTSIRWLTSIDCGKRPTPIPLIETYSPEKYPSFDNFPAINVDSSKEIPSDYYGLMGVPITFLDKWNPEQFEVVDCLNRYTVLDSQGTNEHIQAIKSHAANVNGTPKYARVIIRRKQHGE